MGSSTLVNRGAKTPVTPLSLTHSDLFTRYLWVGLTLGFEYHLQSTRLEHALQLLLDRYPSVAGRVCLDAEGKCCIGRGDGVSLTVAENQSLGLADVPATFVQAQIPGQLPNNLLLPDFLEQIQPHQILAGEEPVMKLRLTQLSDGCVLGISVSHMLADGEALGQVLRDLALAYNGEPISAREETRLKMQHIISRAAGLQSSTAVPSGIVRAYHTALSAEDAIKATIPCLEKPPPSFEACVQLGAYEFLGRSASEQAGTSHCAQVLHIPGRCLERLQSQMMQSDAVKQSAVGPISKNDITCALLWMINEAGGGCDLTGGLQKSLSNTVGLRSNGCSGIEPMPYFGNALALTTVQPDALIYPKSASNTHSLTDTLTAAASAVRQAVQTFRDDAEQLANAGYAMVAPLTDLKPWQQFSASPEMNPFRQYSTNVSSWRNMFNKVDFGEGHPALGFGFPGPIQSKTCVVTEGHGKDGVLCALCFPEADFERLQASQVLHCLAPEASFIQKRNSLP